VVSRLDLKAPEAVDQVLMDQTPVAVATGPLIPMIIGCALFMQTLDSTVISNALPTMARALHEDAVTLNLAITSYLLAAAVFLPISGWVADRFGAKRIFSIAIALFALSSLFCGLAQSLPELVLARMVQGMAGAMMTPVGRLVLLRSVPKSDLVRAMSWLTMPAMLGPVLGPPIGGFITTFMSWRWIFFINIPIGILGVALVTVFIRDIREAHTPPLDVRGFILTGFGLAGIVYGFENLGRGMLPFTVVAGLLVGGAICLLLYARHAKRTPHAILDLGLLRIPTFLASTVGGFFMRMGIGATPFLLALLLQMGFGMSAFAAGMMTFAGGAGALLMKTTARPILARFGFKRVLIVNGLITGVSFMSYYLFRSDTAHAVVITALLVGGFFRSLQFTALNTLAFADVDQSQMSRASSLSSMGQQLAQSVGIGLAALVLGLVRDMHRDASGVLRAADVSPVFVVIGVISLTGLFFFIALPSNAGAEVSGKQERGRSGAPVLAHAVEED
jgi:EmrB/QacA subfamily drug resistance transporter